MSSPVSFLYNSLNTQISDVNKNVDDTRSDIENTLKTSVIPATEVIQKSDVVKWAVDIVLKAGNAELSLAKMFIAAQAVKSGQTVDYSKIEVYADPQNPTESSPYFKPESGDIDMVSLHSTIKSNISKVSNYPATSGSALDKFLSEVANFIGIVQNVNGTVLPYPVVRVSVGKYDMPSDMLNASAAIFITPRTVKGTTSPITDKLWVFGYTKLSAGLKSGASCSVQMVPGFAVYDGEMMSYSGWLPNGFAVSVSNGGQVWVESFVSF